MTDPLRPRTSFPAPRATSAPQQPAPGANPGAGAGQTLAGPPGLNRAPARSPVEGDVGSSSARRAPLPTSSRPGQATGPRQLRAIGHSGASSSGAPATPLLPSAQLGLAAQRLADLEQRRTALSAKLDEAKQARQANAGRTDNTELTKLQGRIDHAATQLNRLRIDRATQLGKLEKTERQLDSCERSLKALLLDDTPAPARQQVPIADGQRRTTPAEALPVVDAPRISAEETAAQWRVQQLTDAVKSARSELAVAKQVLADARKEVATATAAVEAVVSSDVYMPRADQLATTRLRDHLRSFGLPAVDQPPPRGRPDLRLDAYLAHFTEVGADGAHTLSAGFQAPREAFAAFSAVHGALQSNAYQDLLKHLLPVDLTAISTSLSNGGEDLEAIVRPMTTAAFHYIVSSSQRMVDMFDHTRGALRPRRVRISTGPISQVEVRVRAESNRKMLQLMQTPAHLSSIIDGAVQEICEVLRATVLPKLVRALEELAQAADRLDEAKAGQRPAFQRPIDADRELAAAREELQQLVNERRERAAAVAPRTDAGTRAGPSEAAIPRTEIASTFAPDVEARQLKLRGDIVKHTDAVDTARQAIDQLDTGLRQAELEVRRAEDQYETADAAQARGRAGARRQHTEQRRKIGDLRRDLDELDTQVTQARDELDQHPSRRALVSDRAWVRAVERHVEPDDAALRARIRAGETGRNGAYRSRAELALAAADIHAYLSQQPDFQAVLAARSRVDFERAAAALPGGATDLVHDHGRGFSSDPDQTDLPTPLTQSSFSLQFVQGRVVVSHLYPYVPHRQLTTTDRMSA